MLSDKPTIAQVRSLLEGSRIERQSVVSLMHGFLPRSNIVWFSAYLRDGSAITINIPASKLDLKEKPAND